MRFPASRLAVFLAAALITGKAWVIDGDTIVVHGTHIRLWGIDAPEMDTKAGRYAKSFLMKFIARQPVACEAKDRDRYGRVVALCRRADGDDLAALMVAAGQARDWPEFSGGAYRSP